MSPHRCPIDGYPVDIATDGAGNVVVKCEACRRRGARRCMECGQPVVGRSWRCETHKLMAQKEASRISGIRNRDERNAAYRRRYRNLSPEDRRRQCDRKAGWRRRNPMKVAMEKRRSRLKGTSGYRTREKYLEYQQRYNDNRAEAKREYMKTKAVWFGRKPHCAKCGGVIAWDRRGRPKKYHPKCNPWTQRKAA